MERSELKKFLIYPFLGIVALILVMVTISFICDHFDLLRVSVIDPSDNISSNA